MPNSTHFLVFCLFFHLLSPFLPGLSPFARLYTGCFPCCACFLLFSFILPPYMQSKCALCQSRALFHVKRCFPDISPKKQSLFNLHLHFALFLALKTTCRLYSKCATGYLRRFAGSKTSHKLFRAACRLLKTAFRRPKRLIGSFKVTY